MKRMDGVALVLMVAASTSAFGQAFGIGSRAANTTLLIEDLPPSTASMELVAAFPAIHGMIGTPMGITEVPDGSGRMVVWDRSGVIYIFPKDDATTETLTELMDLTDRVSTFFEFGLLGIAFDPNYASSGEIYVHYNREDPLQSVVARYTNNDPSDNTINSGTEDIVLTLDQPEGNHNGGTIEFGPDGMLYLCFGDGGGPDARVNSQDPAELLGKMLRLDVQSIPADPEVQNYVIPPDNPFVGADGILDEIYAFGFRNPFRWGFDRLTGTLYLGDVGENRFEEINIIRAGENYGWPVMEGESCFTPSTGCDQDGLTLPIDIKSHSADGVAAIVGGYVSYSDAVPELYGMYIYSDAYAGKVWGLRYDGTSVSDETLLLQAGSFSPYGFGQDLDGEVYVVDADGGEIWVLRPSGAPTANDFPLKLSDIPALLDAGLGIDQTDAGILPFEPSAKLWSDGALKERFMALPGLEQATFATHGGFGFPDETVLIKNFVLPMDFRDPAGTGKRVETRLLIKHSGSWNGFSYFWNDDETDAHLLPGSALRAFDLIDENGDAFDYEYFYPSRSDCQRCHTAVNNGVAGITAAQMNFAIEYPDSGVTDNQLRTLDHIGFFDAALPAPIASLPAAPDPADTSAPIADRAEAYLLANCAICHQPGGPTPVDMNFRWNVPLELRNIFDVPPTQGDLGIANARRFAPGDPDRSVIAARMAHLDEFRMPPLATSRVDAAGLDVIRAWIEATTEAAPAHVWVDFEYTGTEAGTESQPFNTLAEGIAAVRTNGHVHLAPGVSTETPTLSTPVKISVTGGVARIGD